MAARDYTPQTLAVAAGADPWALARQVIEARPDAVADVGRSFEARAEQAAEATRLADTADLSTENAHLQDGVPVYDAAGSRRQTRHWLSEGGERFTDTGRVFGIVAEGLTDAGDAARRHLRTITDDVNSVVARRNRFFAEHGRNLLPEDADAAERGFHDEAVQAVRAGAVRVQAELDGFGTLLRSRTAHLAELTDDPAPTTPNSGGGSDPWGAAAGAVLNGVASLGNAIAHNPLEAFAVVGGGALAAVSAAGVAGSVALDATGVGAVVGVPLGGLSALGVATGVGIAGVAGASIVNDALGPDRVDVTSDSDNAPTADNHADATVGQDVVIAENPPDLLIDRQQIEKKYESHATDFGVTASRGATGFNELQEAVQDAVESPTTLHIQGSYRGEPAILNFDPETNLVVVQRPDGTFVSGWRAGEAQRENILDRGSLR